jgi:hypothetical protein
MLTYDERSHFSDHGWVLLDGIFSEDQCRAYIGAMDHFARTRRSTDPSAAKGLIDEMTYVDNLVLYDDIFLEWLKAPGILDANRQLIGAGVRLAHSHAHIKTPHPDRTTRRAELANYEGNKESWHRELRPKWGTFAHDEDSRLVNCTYLNNITYLTPVEPGDGGTAVLDGSHRLEGDYRSLKSSCPVREMTAPAGSVLIFTESLIHSGRPILSENTRYNMYYGFVPPWYNVWPGFDVPDLIVDAIADEELRDILRPSFYRAQDDASAGASVSEIMQHLVEAEAATALQAS